jgi:hypothetical protein
MPKQIQLSSKVLELIEKHEDVEYKQAKELVDQLFEDKAQRIKLYIIVAAEKKLEDIEKFRQLIDKLEKRVAGNIETLSMEESIEALNALVKSMESHSKSVEHLLDLLNKGV